MPARFRRGGDGKVDQDLYPDECLGSSHSYVTIFGDYYRYAVAPDGDHLKLWPAKHPGGWSHALPIGKRAPGFAFTDLHGTRRHLRDYRGRVILLDFWGTWCIPCVEQMPALVDLYDRHHVRGLEIIGIAYDEAANLREHVEELNYRWPQSPQGERKHIFDLYRVDSFPTGSILSMT